LLPGVRAHQGYGSARVRARHFLLQLPSNVISSTGSPYHRVSARHDRIDRATHARIDRATHNRERCQVCTFFVFFVVQIFNPHPPAGYNWVTPVFAGPTSYIIEDREWTFNACL